LNRLSTASLTLAAEPLRDLSSQPVGLLHSTQPTQTSSEQLGFRSFSCWVLGYAAGALHHGHYTNAYLGKAPQGSPQLASCRQSRLR
jgi:hypothetical protein